MELKLAVLSLFFVLIAADSRSGRFFQELLFDPKDEGQYLEGNSAPAPEMWFTQKLDHYDPADTRTWKQRYYINSTYWGGLCVM